ncbi:response regulator [Moorella sulfitireducens]|uniref:response regulator n=1 Tax=Neomoorella sulfitireducens TaxID=2972948 RepID=UPI0021AD0007|nr:response regulator transcription factor [Moorella sulfitireducens]
MDKGKIRIIVADDQALMRDGLKTIIDLEVDMEVVGATANGQETWVMVQELMPDVVLLDVRMPVMDGVECVRLIKEHFPPVKVIMLTTFDDEDYIINALAYGADGYLLKDIQADQLLAAIRNAYRGQLILPARVAGKLATRVAGFLELANNMGKKAEQKAGDPTLSAREQEVAALMVSGLNNRQIARQLQLTEGTVKNYISVIYEKIGTSDRKTAVAILAKQFPHIKLNHQPGR